MAVTSYVNENQRALIWESLLGADYRTRYFGELAGQLQAMSRHLAVANLVLSSGALANIAGALAPEWVSLAAIGMVACVSAIQLVLKFSDRAGDAADLHTKWDHIQVAMEQLWAELEGLDAGAAMARWSAIEASHAEFDKKAAKEFGYKRRLAKRAWREMLHRRKLHPPSTGLRTGMAQ